MPELYGNKFKYELRDEISQLNVDLREAWNRAREYRSENIALRSLYRKEVERRE